MTPAAAPAIEDLWFLDTLVTVRIPHDHGADGMSVLDSVAPHGDSPPLHIHHREDEIFHVLDGELTLRVGAELLTIGAGDTVLAPRGVPHTYRVTSHQTARWLIITQNGNFERFLRALSRPAHAPELPQPSGPPTPQDRAALAATARQHGIEIVGPPLEL